MDKWVKLSLTLTIILCSFILLAASNEQHQIYVNEYCDKHNDCMDGFYNFPNFWSILIIGIAAIIIIVIWYNP